MGRLSDGSVDRHDATSVSVKGELVCAAIDSGWRSEIALIGQVANKQGNGNRAAMLVLLSDMVDNSDLPFAREL